MSFSNYMENAIMKHIFGKGSYSVPTLYLGLAANIPPENCTGANCYEVPNAGNYARILVIASKWSINTVGYVWNNVELAFASSTTGWGTIRAFLLLDSGTYGAGNVLAFGGLDHHRVVYNLQQPKFPIGDVHFDLD